MNPGDEVDDNIWVRRPRNRLQPGQTQAPDPAARSLADRAPPSPVEASTAKPGDGALAAGAASEPGTRAAKSGNGAASKSNQSVASKSTRGAAPAWPTGAANDAPADSSTAALAPSADAATPLAPAPDLGLAAAGEAGPRQRSPRARRDELPLPASDLAPPPATSAPPVDERADAPALPGGRSEGKPVWSVALMTFSGDDHRATAEAACRQIVQTIPDLKGAFVRTRHNGSVLMWGEFDGPRDPRAKEELARLKQVTVAGNRPFARAMLARLEQFSEEEMGPWDLRQVRRRHPNVRVIYTLQVAAWSDLGSGTMNFEQIRRSAEEHCRKIRAQGVEAWYHHDADQLTSIVTVGVFDANAYDAQSTLYSREVEAMRKRFPVSLVNGTEIMIQGDPKRPEALVPQPSRLVEVPR